MFGNAWKALTAGAGSLLAALVFLDDKIPGWAIPDAVETPLGIAIAVLTPVVTYLVKPGRRIVTPPVLRPRSPRGI